MRQTNVSRLLLGLTLTSAIMGLILITFINLRDNPAGRLDFTLSNAISYFTIQSNILVVMASGYLLIYQRKYTKAENFILLGTLINISITGIVYATLLTEVWDPKGLAFIADALLHYVTPLLFLLYFLLFLPKKVLSYKVSRYWFLYPVIYFIYTMIRGAITNFYPYPFVDGSELTAWELTVNIVAMSVFFLLMGALFTWINNKLAVRAK